MTDSQSEESAANAPAHSAGALLHCFSMNKTSSLALNPARRVVAPLSPQANLELSICPVYWICSRDAQHISGETPRLAALLWVVQGDFRWCLGAVSGDVAPADYRLPPGAEGSP